MSPLLEEAQRVHDVAGLSDRAIAAATGAKPSTVRGWLAGRSEPTGSLLPARPRAVEGTWIRHVPHQANLLGHSSTPSDGRWQRGEIVPALYLADTVETATAEWYRSLAEWGLAPQDHVPYDHHRWRLELELADLGDAERRLREVMLQAPRPSPQTWPAHQRIGEQLWREGWAGLIAPSAARPGSLIVCVFASAWPPAGCTPLDTRTVATIPPPPRGMTT